MTVRQRKNYIFIELKAEPFISNKPVLCFSKIYIMFMLMFTQFLTILCIYMARHHLIIF